jgi:hypothetical protein
VAFKIILRSLGLTVADLKPFYVPVPFKCWSWETLESLIWIEMTLNSVFLIACLFGVYRFVYKQRRCSIILLTAFYVIAIIG